MRLVMFPGLIGGPLVFAAGLYDVLQVSSLKSRCMTVEAEAREFGSVGVWVCVSVGRPAYPRTHIRTHRQGCQRFGSGKNGTRYLNLCSAGASSSI